MIPPILSIGIAFNAFVSALVASAAFLLIVALIRRRRKLNLTMRSYTWFWWFTMLVWIPSTMRYTLMSLGKVGPWIYQLDVLVQAAIFFSGPPLFYYLSLRVFQNEQLAKITGFISSILGSIAIWLIMRPGGVQIYEARAFSAEVIINNTALAIFGVQIIIIFGFLLYDTTVRLRRWRQDGRGDTLYTALYSTSLIVYLLLGSIDESKIITDWPLIVFRVLYAGSFLFVYLILTQHETEQKKYLVIASKTNAPYA